LLDLAFLVDVIPSTNTLPQFETVGQRQAVS